MAQDIIARIVRYHLPCANEIAEGFGWIEPYRSNFIANTPHQLSFLPAPIAEETSCGRGSAKSAADAEKQLGQGAADSLIKILSEKRSFPLADNSADGILTLHALEFCPNAQTQMREFGQILAPNGRLILAVPNKRELWVRREQMPFGHEQLYSRSWLAELQRVNNFSFGRIYEVSHVLPSKNYNLTLFPYICSRFAKQFMSYFGAVLITEAHKQIYKPIDRQKQNLASFSSLPLGLTTPQAITRMGGKKEESMWMKDG